MAEVKKQRGIGKFMASMKPKLSEHDVQRLILDWLGMRGYFHWRNNSGAMVSSYKGKKRFMRFGAVGSPDIFAIIKGSIVGIEVKGPNGKLSPHQQIFSEGFRRAGGHYVVAHSLDDVLKYLGL